MSDEQITWLVEHILDNWTDWQVEADQHGSADVLRDFLRHAIKRAMEDDQ